MDEAFLFYDVKSELLSSACKIEHADTSAAELAFNAFADSEFPSHVREIFHLTAKAAYLLHK